tara:strand:- start:2557 stop:3333 length:777 start_codon:yes stop_codon:yes gene_type:complete
MKQVLIGSKAIKFWFETFPREPNDTDYAVLEKRDRDGSIEYLYNPVLVEYCNSDRKQFIVDNALIPSIDTLLTLKASHLFWDIKWEKHLFDACYLIKKGAKINKELFYDLVKFWEKLHGPRKNSDLTLDADAFFDNAINGKNGLDHDHLHTLIKEVPTYTKILKGETSVEPCEDLFNNLSYDLKKSLFEEEVMVMAYERFRKIGYRHAFTKMLKKFIMNHAPLWGVPFIIENYLELEKPSINYYKTIENGNRIYRSYG